MEGAGWSGGAEGGAGRDGIVDADGGAGVRGVFSGDGGDAEHDEDVRAGEEFGVLFGAD